MSSHRCALQRPNVMDFMASVVAALCVEVHEPEHVVEDIVAAGLGAQLEGLGVAHRSLLFINLVQVVRIWDGNYSDSAPNMLTRSAPVTNTNIPPSSLDGWASRVVTWCFIWENGSA